MTSPLLQRLRHHVRWIALVLPALAALTAYAVGWFDRTPESFRDSVQNSRKRGQSKEGSQRWMNP